jgi:hypothetical protein
MRSQPPYPGCLYRTRLSLLPPPSFPVVTDGVLYPCELPLGGPDLEVLILDYEIAHLSIIGLDVQKLALNPLKGGRAG